MRTTTALMSQWRADTQSGENLQFKLCKGGYFSNKEEYGLKVVGKTFQDATPNPDNPIPIQCVKAGTKIICGNEITVPCDLYKGDIWYPMNGKVEKHNNVIVLDESIQLTMNVSDWFNFYIWYPHKQKTSMCSHYKRVNAYSSEALNTTNHFQDNINSNILYFKLEQATVEDVKNYWKSQKEQGVPVTVVYELETPKIKQYAPQPIFAPQGMVNVLQEPIELLADLSATVLMKR